MAQRVVDIPKRPSRSKRNRGESAKHAQVEGAAEAHEFDVDAHESQFASVTADIVTRAVRLSELAHAEPHAKNRFLGSTSGLLVQKGEAAASIITVSSMRKSARSDQGDAELHRLREELSALTATLAERDAALAESRSDRSDRPQQDQAALADAEEAWKAAEATRFAEAEARWQGELAEIRSQAESAGAQADGLRSELAALQSTLADREAALAKATSDQERALESQRREIEATDHATKATESTRLAEAEAQVAELRAQAEAARSEVESERAQADGLRSELATLQSTLADREAALSKATSEHEQVLETRQREIETEQARAQRLAEAEAQLSELSAQVESERERADATRQQSDEDLRKLRDASAVLQSTLAERDAALAQAASDHEQARTNWQQESQAALSKAEQDRKAAADKRLAEAEAKWQEQSTNALAEARAQADETIRGLQDQLTAVQTTLAECETALAQAASQAEEVRERGRQELETAVAKMKAWQAEETQRLAAAEARWQKQSADAIREAQSRYEAAEGALIQLRRDSDRARSDATGGSIRPSDRSGDRSSDRAMFGAKPAGRDPDPVAIRLPSREDRNRGAEGSSVVIQSHRMMSDQNAQAPKKRGAGRDILVVAVLVIVAIVAYPRIKPLLPPALRANIDAVIGGAGSGSVAPRVFAAVVSDVNLRSGPSTTSEVIATLPRGLRVATILQRGDWTLVELEADASNPAPRRGWVFASFLRGETTGLEDEVETAPSDETD